MAHVRSAIRTAVTFNVNATASLTAYQGRTYPVDDDKLPAARIYTPEEIVTDAQDMDDDQEREIVCVIEILAKGDAVENDLDDYCVEVEEKLDTNMKPNTNVHNIVLRSTTIELDELEKDIGKATLTYSIFYVVNPSDVETVVT